MKKTVIASLIPAAILAACGGSISPALYQGGAQGHPILSFVDPSATYDLNNYTQKTMIPLPQQDQNNPQNLLGDEASGIAFDTDTKKDLYVIGDGATAVVHTDLNGKVLDSMALNPGDFEDTEGITYIGGGKMVLVEERLRQIDLFTYVPGGTLSRGQVRSIKTGTTVGNIGIEGVSYDAMTGGFFGARQTQPESIFLFKTDPGFTTATDSAGQPMTANTDNPTPLFPNEDKVTGLSDFNDVYALSNVLQASAPDYGDFLITSAPDGKVEKLDRQGHIKSFLNMDPKGQNEGVTMGNDGTIYLAGEQAAGPSKPGITIFTPTTNASNVGVGSNLFLTFDKAAAAGSGKITLSNGSDTREIDVSDPTQITFEGNTVKIHPKYYLQAKTTYSITYPANTFKGMAAVKDQTALSFATIGVSDTTAPSLDSMSPANGAVGISGNMDTMVFNESVIAGTGNIEISGGSDSRQIDVNDASQVRFNGTKMLVTLKSNLQLNTKYTVTLSKGVVTDLYGNPAPQVTQTFTTGAGGNQMPSIMITEVNSNALGPLPTDNPTKPSKQDFFELYNYGSNPVDLTGWVWGDNHASATDLNNTAPFPAGTVIQPGERIITMPGIPGVNDKAFYKSWNVAPDVQVLAMENMNNDPANLIGLGGGDAVIVYDASGKVAAALNYGPALSVAQGDGSTVTIPSVPGSDPTLIKAANHAGSVFPGTGTKATDGHSAVWVPTSGTANPIYQSAAVGDTISSYAEPGDASGGSVGSPGK
ncbi:Ig-like domain-containing protein [Paraburkholderia sp. FT54]|uniref:SdiA-regulated domain-containing protein n=1 Tax=Paraburkholderia sp. FT54 TaxID=3074437 RepID=UPI00287738E2|nr:SdiA-regulated domain-containing protein [Paraburkholderia sp. FT54]WNC94453.1 Ig-like domain-containing protein [Paraburkholderia sp. FT54]